MSGEIKDYMVIFRVGVRVQAHDEEEAENIAKTDSLNENAFETVEEVKEVML